MGEPLERDSEYLRRYMEALLAKEWSARMTQWDRILLSQLKISPD